MPQKKSFLGSADSEENLPRHLFTGFFQQQLCCNRPCSKLSRDSVACEAHILNYVFFCGLVPNLINSEKVVGGMSQLLVAPQSIPEESP